MAARTLRPLANPLLQPRTTTPLHRSTPSSSSTRTQQRRTFLPNPFAASSPQTLTARRTLSHPPSVIYSTISDVSSYSAFIPYCRASLVTKTSQPASDGKSYPEEAKLIVGFHDDVSEEFWSRVYCQPERVVEAVSGLTESSLRPGEVPHHSARPAAERDPTRNGDVLTRLATRWTLKPVGEKTEVELAIEYQFANPIYGALSAAAAPKVAEKMIEAFEGRVKAVAEGRS